MVCTTLASMVRLKHLRLAANLTQERLAELVGVTHATVQRWESAQRDMPSSKVPRIAAALGCHPGELFMALPGALSLTPAQKEAAGIADRIRAKGIESWLEVGRTMVRGAEAGSQPARPAVVTTLPRGADRAKPSRSRNRTSR